MHQLLLPLLLALAASVAALESAPTAAPTTTSPVGSAASAGAASEFHGRVAVACSDGKRRAALAWSEENAIWREVPGASGCPASDSDANAIRDLCRQAYPGKTIVNVEPAVEHEAFPSWCPVGASHRRLGDCPILNVRPFECLSGPFQSPSLLVSRGCQFKHNSTDNDNCKQYADWATVAKDACAKIKLPGNWHLDRSAPLRPCNQMLSAGYYAGVEFVCCPKAVIEVSPPKVDPPRKVSKKAIDDAAAAVAAMESKAKDLQSPSDLLGLGKDADEARYQRYLTLATESGHSEHERFLDAKRGLRHHHAIRESAMVKELQGAESRILRLSPRDPDSAQRLLAEVEKQFRRSFLSVQREEEAEHDQLDSVHQQRVNLLFVGKLTHVKRLLAESISDGNAKAAKRYFARLAGLIAREIVRLSNRANRLSPRITSSHLAILRRHASALRTDLSDSSADASLRHLLDMSAISGVLVRYETVLTKADKQLAEAKAGGDSSDSAGLYPPRLAERFDNLLRLYHEQSFRILAQARHQPKQQHHQHHHQRHNEKPHLPKADSTSSSSSDIKDRHHNHRDHKQEQDDPQEANKQHAKSASATLHSEYPRQSVVFVVIFCVLAFLLTMVVIFVTVRICRMVYGANSPAGKGYKLSLVDEDTKSPLPPVCCDTPYNYPTLHPEKACLGDAHLANMQMNGYENPTYKFYEEK